MAPILETGSSPSNQGKIMINKRSDKRTIRCNWCYRINYDGHWIKERRKKASGEYQDVVCKKCKGFYFGDPDITRTIKEISEWEA